MKTSLIGWHAFSFHCKFVARNINPLNNKDCKYICKGGGADGKECHENNCLMFAEGKETELNL